jgi:hypothetical protein
MTRISIDEEGPGSFSSMSEYVEDVLRENFTVIPEKDMTTGKEDQYMRRARNIVTSILSRLNIDIV